MMDGQRRWRIVELFEEAMDLAPEEQARLLDRECGSDVEFRRAVQRLLDADFTEQPVGCAVQRLLDADFTEQPVGALHAPTELERIAALRDIALPDTQVPSDATTAVPSDTRTRERAITTGTRIGSYHIVERLGEGSMGAVFLAQHEKLRHDAAVKVLLPSVPNRPGSILRFQREAEIAAAISHPGVVKVMDYGRHASGDWFILMERLHGETLRDRLLSARKLSPRTAISFAIQIARTLEAVHVHYVHRDLKPDNLFLVPDSAVPGGERVKILDFGIAKVRGAYPRITPNFTLMGTPPYMAPEQYWDAAGVSDLADLYSLGVVLFQMLCGQLPFQCQSLHEYSNAHQRQTPPPVERYAQVSSGLSDVVARLLAKSRRERFQSARTLVEALEALPEMQVASSSKSERITPRAIHDQAIHSEIVQVLDQVETVSVRPWPRAPREYGDAASASPLYTEAQAMAPEAIEPMQEPTRLAPGDTVPGSTVVIGGRSWRMTSSETTAPGMTALCAETRTP
jgi:serine/threonine protein kinase